MVDRPVKPRSSARRAHSRKTGPDAPRATFGSPIPMSMRSPPSQLPVWGSDVAAQDYLSRTMNAGSTGTSVEKPTGDGSEGGPRRAEQAGRHARDGLASYGT